MLNFSHKETFEEDKEREALRNANYIKEEETLEKYTLTMESEFLHFLNENQIITEHISANILLIILLVLNGLVL